MTARQPNRDDREPSMADNPADPLKKKNRLKRREEAGGSALAHSMDKGAKGRAFATGNNITDYGKRRTD